MNLLLIRFNHASSTKNASWSPPTVWQLYKKRMCSYKNTKWYKSSNDQRENNYLSTSLNPFIMVAPEFVLLPSLLFHEQRNGLTITVVLIWSEITVLGLVLALPFPPRTPPLTCILPCCSDCFHVFLISTFISAMLPVYPKMAFTAFHHHFTSSATRVNSFEWLRVSSDTITAICVVVMVINLPTASHYPLCITSASHSKMCFMSKNVFGKKGKWDLQIVSK